MGKENTDDSFKNSNRVELTSAINTSYLETYYAAFGQSRSLPSKSCYPFPTEKFNQTRWQNQRILLTQSTFSLERIISANQFCFGLSTIPTYKTPRVFEQSKSQISLFRIIFFVQNIQNNYYSTFNLNNFV